MGISRFLHWLGIHFPGIYLSSIRCLGSPAGIHPDCHNHLFDARLCDIPFARNIVVVTQRAIFFREFPLSSDVMYSALASQPGANPEEVLDAGNLFYRNVRIMMAFPNVVGSKSLVVVQ